MNGIVIARGGVAEVVTLSDRLRPPGHRLRRRLDPRLPGLGLRRPARALGARRGARRRGARAPRRDRLPAADRPPRRIGRGRRGRGADPRRPDGRPRPARDRRRPRRRRAPLRARRARARRGRAPALPAAARDPLPHRRAGPAADRARDADRQPRARALGRGRRPGGHVPPGRRDDPARAARRRPARLRDRVADTNVAALDRAEAAARLLDASRSSRELRASTSTHYGEILAAAQAGGYRFAHFEGAPPEGTVILRHDVDLSLDAAAADGRARARRRRERDVLPDDRVGLLQPRLERGRRRRSRGCASSATASRCTPSIRTRPLDERFDPVVAWHNPDPEYMRAPLAGRADQRDAGAVVRPGHVPLGLEPALALRLPARRPRAPARSRGCSCSPTPRSGRIPGETMGQTMRAMLEAEKERRLQQLADDRIDLT